MQTQVQKEYKFKRMFTSPSLEIARFTLYNYVRSGWILFDIVLVWLIFATFFYAYSVRASEFFGIATPSMVVETILGTVIMVRRAMRPSIYLPLSRLSSRSPYLYGVMIATGILRIPLYLLLLLLIVIRQNFIDMNWDLFLSGSLGLLLICILCALLVVALSKPIATRLTLIIFLAWIVLALYSRTLNSPQFLTVFQVPLQPIAMCYQFAVQGEITGWDWFWAAIIILYMVATIFIARYAFSRRDIHLI
ncbi:hypothetical protein KDA_35540 [Dictyobacter alpinus]|uniref:Uncharacterized protein n=1 Tax=Dictyobacter alpinus TaxID=2014873 RepID=A0A402B9T5_9CHLR|nr:hypothetical protein [Dictyobacter alpinus]GCE28070.1 hypothetical protein KDA_35540 [Dictyobacter alpinus]